MRGLIIFFVLFGFSSTISGGSDLNKLSLSICNIIDEFYAKYSRNVDIIDFGGHQGDLVDGILGNLNNSMTVTLIRIQNPQNWNRNIENQSILLFEHFRDLKSFNDKDLLIVKFINPIRLLVYCKGLLIVDVESLNTVLVTPPYYYFLIMDQEPKLYTFENRQDLIHCHESQKLVLINEFSPADTKWTRYPIMPKKYKNFHNCSMSIGLFSQSMFLTARKFDQNVKVQGLLLDILLELSSSLNFMFHIQGCPTNECMVKIMKKHYLYNIFIPKPLDVYAIAPASREQWNNVMINVQCTPQFLVPPGDLYKSVEKIILPFDCETWIGILSTFTFVTVSVLIYNQLPRKLKKFIYKQKLQMFGICRAFFGEGHVNLPKRHSARLIFVTFSIWCFIIRTAYQGKLFDFVTTAARRLEVKTIEEMRTKNYTIYFPSVHMNMFMTDYIRNVTGLPIQKVTSEKYTSIYLKNISNPSFTGSVITCDLHHAMQMFTLQKPLPKRFVPTPIQNTYFAVGFAFSNLWNERLEEIINGLINGGIINYFIEKYIKSKWNLMTVVGSGENIVLNLSHLGFGFQICFFALYICFLVFLLELVVNWVLKCFEAKGKKKLAAAPK